MKIIGFTYLISKESGRSRPHYVRKSPEGFKVSHSISKNSLLTDFEILEVMKELFLFPQIHIQVTSP